MTSNAAFVLDTNSVISALLLPTSLSRQAFDHAFALGTILASTTTLDEVDSVLRRPKFDRYIHVDERLRFLSSYIQSVTVIEISVTITDCRDVKDNKFLELAVSGSATCIISGDRDLSDLSPYRNIPILSARAFLDHYRP